MKIIYLLLCILSLTTAKVQPRTGVNDVFDGVEGVIYDIPEYEDPEVSLFKLISRGVMPVVVKGLSDLSNKDDKPHYQTDDIKKGLDTVITQLQEAKNKLENGNNAVYLDIDKSVLSLENLKHHLYIDLHSTAASRKPSVTPDIITKGSSAKAPIFLKTSIKKYISADYPVHEYFSFDIPSGKSLSSYKFPHSSFGGKALIPHLSSKDAKLPSSIQQPLSVVSENSVYSDDTSASEPDFDENQKLDSSSELPLSVVSENPFYSDDASASEPDFYENQNLDSSSELPLIEDPFHSDDTSASEPVFAEKQNLPLHYEEPVNLGSSTEHPAAIDKSVYEFKLLGSAASPIELIPYAKEMKTDVVDGVSPAKFDQAEPEDKTLIRKKLSLKISTLGSIKK